VPHELLGPGDGRAADRAGQASARAIAGRAGNWSATTRQPGTSLPNCCAANIGPRHRNCARWHIARA
jgi:hypothetical protein